MYQESEISAFEAVSIFNKNKEEITDSLIKIAQEKQINLLDCIIEIMDTYPAIEMKLAIVKFFNENGDNYEQN